MLRYIGKRILYMIPVLLGVTLLVFFIMHLAPGNVAAMILGENATAEQIAELDLKGRELRMKNGERCLFARNMKGALLERM